MENDKTLHEEIAHIISDSSLWNLGKDAHNALSELTCAIVDFIKARDKTIRNALILRILKTFSNG